MSKIRTYVLANVLLISGLATTSAYTPPRIQIPSLHLTDQLDAVIQPAMNDPDCLAAFLLFRSQGGDATLEQFAYGWLRTYRAAQ